MKNRKDPQPRFRPKAGVLVTFVGGSIAGRGVVGDMSRDGVFIQTSVLAPPGTRIHITLRAPGVREIEAEGEVRWNVARLPQDGEIASGIGVALRRYPSEYLALVERIAAESNAGGDTD